MAARKSLLLFIMLFGCDPVYTPLVVNASESSLVISVQYRSGTNWDAVVQPCWTGFIGRGKLDHDPILKLLISKGENVIYQYTKGISKIENDYIDAKTVIIHEKRSDYFQVSVQKGSELNLCN